MLCPKCNSNKVHKDGVRERKNGKIVQEFECQNIACKKYFSVKIQDAILAVLKQSWTNPSYQVSLGGITDAGGAVPEITGITFS